MERFQDEAVDYEPVDPEHFSGRALAGILADVSEPSATRVYRVRFQPGSRTDWHFHSGRQLLLVEEGHGCVQKEGGPVLRIQKGDAALIEPGERHWHGAEPGRPMTHFAVNLDVTTHWLDKVTEEEYRSGEPDVGAAL